MERFPHPVRPAVDLRAFREPRGSTESPRGASDPPSGRIRARSLLAALDAVDGELHEFVAGCQPGSDQIRGPETDLATHADAVTFARSLFRDAIKESLGV